MSVNKGRGGAFLSNSHSSSKRWLIGLIVLIAAFVLATLIGGNGSGERRITYHLPDEAPSFSLPENLKDHTDSRTLEELVVPHYDFLLEAGGNAIDISLPVIQASYGADFNDTVVRKLGTLVSNTMFYLERDESWIVKKVSYEAYLAQDILTVLLLTEYTSGECDTDPWIFDLSQEGKLLEDWELTERLLGIDYATFLWITDRVIENCFVNSYYEEVYTVPESQMSEEQLDILEDYRGILRSIAGDLSSVFGRYIYPRGSEIYLVFDLPLVTSDWHSGFRTVPKTVLIDQTFLGYSDMVTRTEAVEDVIFETTVHVMGASDQVHAQLLRIIFDCDPYSYIAAATVYPKYAVNSLLNYATEDEKKQIAEACYDLKKSQWLSNAELEVVEMIFQAVS